MMIDRPAPEFDRYGADLGQVSGIYPYLGATVGADAAKDAVTAYGSIVVPGRAGARIAAHVGDMSLIDPALYDPHYSSRSGCPIQEPLWPCDEWLERQRAAGAPLLITDSARILRGDRAALREVLGRWKKVDEPALGVLPIDAWWLRDGLPCLIEEVRDADRPVALVLMHHYNALDIAGSVGGLMAFLSAVTPIPVAMLRCDVSAIGAVAHGAFAGFIGMSASLRHGPLPIRINRNEGVPKERDQTPAVLVPTLSDYYKASKLPAFVAVGQDLLRCDCPFCRGTSLLEVTRLCEVDIARARDRAHNHNVAFTEQTACQVLAAGNPRDAWWEWCKSGADVTASMIEFGISLPVSRWLRQWLEVGSPSHDPVMIG